MGDNTLRIGLLGCIRFASKFVRTVTQSSNAVIIAISDPSIETANTFAAANNLSPETVSVYGSYEELLNDPRVDAVYLTMLVTQRAKWAVTAAENSRGESRGASCSGRPAGRGGAVATPVFYLRA